MEMKVTPIIPTFKPVNPPHRHRAFMSIRFNDHAVTDLHTGIQVGPLPAKEAWDLHQKLNMEV